MKKISLRVLVTMALLVAVNLILTRLLVIYLTDFTRLDLGNVPLLLSGFLFGPLAGALTGTAADILGAVISGRGWYPPLTFGPLLMGLIPGLLRSWFRKSPTLPKMALIVIIANFLAAVIWKTYWLSTLYGISYTVCLLTRLPVIAILCAAEIIFVYILYKRLVREYPELQK